MKSWLDWSRRITPWLFHIGSVLCFLACAIRFFAGRGFDAETFVLGAVLAVVPAVLKWLERVDQRRRR